MFHNITEIFTIQIKKLYNTRMEIYKTQIQNYTIQIKKIYNNNKWIRSNIATFRFAIICC